MRTATEFEDGKKYVLDVTFNNASVVTLVSHGNIFGRIKGEDSDWEVMLNRLSHISDTPPSAPVEGDLKGGAIGEGWISVEDKKPPMSKRLLLYHKSQLSIITGAYGNTGFYFDKTCIWVHGEMPIHDINPSDISHWRYSPAPPILFPNRR